MESLQITSKESETARNLRVLGKAAKHTNVREAGSAKLSQAMAEWLRGLRLTMFRQWRMLWISNAKQQPFIIIVLSSFILIN